MGSFRHLALGIGMAASTAAAADAPVAIGLRWAPGQVLTYRLVERDTTLYDPAAPAGTPLPTDEKTTTFTLKPVRVGADGSADVALDVGSITPPGAVSVFTWATEPGGVFVAFDAEGVPREVRGLAPPYEEREPPERNEVARALLEAVFHVGRIGAATAGATWQKVTPRQEARAGTIKVVRTFRLDGVSGTQARLTTRVEARRDAEGKIPVDLSDDRMDWAVEKLSGSGSVDFDVALGQPRHSKSTIRTSYVNRVRRGVVDGFPDYQRTVLELESTASLELVEASGPRPPAAPSVPPAPPASEGLPVFADFARRAQEDCFVAPEDDTNPSLKSAAAAEVRCLVKRSVAELDQVLLPTKTSDEPAFRALMAEQALWNRYVEESCWLHEELAWVDLATRSRGDGTARGYPMIGCERQAALGRGYYAAARRRADPHTFVRHVGDVESQAVKVRTELERVRRTLAGSPSPSDPHPGTTPLGPAAVQKLLETAQTIGSRAGALARATCDGWPALAEALGGASTCRARAEAYYLSHGPREEAP